MGRSKAGKRAKQQQGGKKSPGGSTYVVDRLLIPRLSSYAQHHSLADADAVAEALRSMYKEYQRRPMAAFKLMVHKGIRAVQERGQVPSQGQASRGGSRAASQDGSEDSSDDGSSGSDGGSSSDDGFESGDGSGEPAASGAGRAMNDSLLSMYARPPATWEADESQRAGPGPSSTAQATPPTSAKRARKDKDRSVSVGADAGAMPAANGSQPVGHTASNGAAATKPAAKQAVTGKRRRASSSSSSSSSDGEGGDPRAFAPPEVVAAAASRALAAEKQARTGKAAGPSRPGPNHADAAGKSGTTAAPPPSAAAPPATAPPATAAGSGAPGQGQEAKFSAGPKPCLVLPTSVEPPPQPQQQSQQQPQQLQQSQQQPQEQQQQSQQQQQQHSVPRHTVPPAEAGVAAAVAAAMAAAAAAAGTGAGAGAGGVQHMPHAAGVGETAQPAAADRAAAAAAAASAQGEEGSEGGLHAAGSGVPTAEAMDEDVAAAEAGLQDGAPAQAPSAVAHTPSNREGAPSGRPATGKKARRANPTPGKAGSGGGGNRGGGGGGNAGGSGSAVTVARAITYDDLGGVEDVLSEIRELIEYPLKHPEVYAWLGVEPPRGVLLHGPPGCGKTALANAIANECGVPFLRVSAPEIVSGMSGESEAKLRSLFQEASDVAPCIVFIDEIDAIAPKRETAQREMERRIVAQMLTCMDDLTAPPPATQDRAEQERANAVPICSRHVVVIGASNRPDALDPALRRAGRFDREIALGIPSEAARSKILQVITQRLRLEGNFDFKKVAKRTPGFVGADLMALVKEAAALAVTRIFSSIDAPSPPSCAPSDAPQQPPQQPGMLPAGQGATATEAGTVDGGSRRGGGGGAAAAAGGTTQEGAVAAEGGRQQNEAGQPSCASNQPDAAMQGMEVDNGPAGAGGPAAAPVPAAAAAAQAAAGENATQGQYAAPSQQQQPALQPISKSRFGQGPLQAHELQGLAITMADFEAAVTKVQPSVRREGFATTPDVTWEDVGSLDEVREELSFCITQPIMHPERFQALGLSSATGVLLYGPPGCGKTLVAKAVAHESGANFMSIKGPELLNKYVGESERAVRQLFSRARAAHPCVLFFDELDALAPRRGTDTNQAAERVVNQLLTEMDGIDGRLGVFLVAATNRPDMIDPALLRPGRLDKILYVPLPPPDGRAAILKALVRNTPLAPGVDVQAIGMSARCSGFSGADMAALVREACVLALKESMRTAAAATASSAAAGVGADISACAEKPCVHVKHFEEALGRVAPSVSRKDQRCYDALRSRLRSSRGRLEVADDTAGAAATGGQKEGGQKQGGGQPPSGGAPGTQDTAAPADAATQVNNTLGGSEGGHPGQQLHEGDEQGMRERPLEGQGRGDRG